MGFDGEHNIAGPLAKDTISNTHNRWERGSHGMLNSFHYVCMC